MYITHRATILAARFLSQYVSPRNFARIVLITFYLPLNLIFLGVFYSFNIM